MRRYLINPGSKSVGSCGLNSESLNYVLERIRDGKDKGSK